MSLLPGGCRGAAATAARRLLLLSGPHARVGGRRPSAGASRPVAWLRASGLRRGRVRKRAVQCGAVRCGVLRCAAVGFGLRRAECRQRVGTSGSSPLLSAAQAAPERWVRFCVPSTRDTQGRGDTKGLELPELGLCSLRRRGREVHQWAEVAESRARRAEPGSSWYRQGKRQRTQSGAREVPSERQERFCG